MNATETTRRAWLRGTRAFLLAGWISWTVTKAVACGPHFPNWLLADDDQVLSAPVASFGVELAKLEIPIPAYPAHRREPHEHPREACEAELADLKQALEERGLRERDLERVLGAHAAQRRALAAYVQLRYNWENRIGVSKGSPPPALPSVQVVQGLPPEFADYFSGALAWHCGDTNGAAARWSTLLRLPPDERRYRSTWAAFMLGRHYEQTSPSKAKRYYQAVRSYVDEGFKDRIGLAFASLGCEGRIHYNEGAWAEAMDLYLQQAATGDPSALLSLRLTAKKAFDDRGRALPRLAKNPTHRSVITAYLVSTVYPQDIHMDGPLREGAIHALQRINRFRGIAAGWHQYEKPVVLWLEAVEEARVTTSDEAELLALAAYQGGEFEVASRWLDHASTNTLALWLRAKLLLRDGQLAAAADRLGRIVRMLRTESTPEFVSGDQLEGYAFPLFSPRTAVRTPGDEALGEWGALQLAQSEYALALDALLRAGYWMDAAYVAESVLTVDELKRYVEDNWSEPEATRTNGPNLVWYDTDAGRQADRIRHLLARRLTRLGRRAEAASFVPSRHAELLRRLDETLTAGYNEATPPAERAANLWDAAQLLKNNGMELIGTELEPDWAIHQGEYDFGVSVTNRLASGVLPPTANEVGRASQHHPIPERRFHYRYAAAEVAWQAAELMPDNTDKTALVLWIAGSWLKYMDPGAADHFYKALVNRCRKTKLGRAADERRWFPRESNMAVPSPRSD